jgi:thiol:disulfide interchange protein
VSAVVARPADPRRLAWAIAASAAVAAVIYVLVVRLALPALASRLTAAHVEWLRWAFARHPWAVLGALVVISAVLALPVPGVFLVTYRVKHEGEEASEERR